MTSACSSSSSSEIVSAAASLSRCSKTARALRGRQLLDDVGDVGGVQLVQPLVRDGQLDLRQVAVEQVHVVPRDDVLVELLSEELGDPRDEALERRGDAAQDAAHADLGAEQAQLVAGLGELEVVDAHDLHALRVDDLLAHQVAREQDLVGLQVAEADLRARDVEHDLLAVEERDELAPREHERRLVGPEERQRRHAREDLARGDRDVVDGADFLAAGIDHRLAQHLGQVDHGFPLPPGLAARASGRSPAGRLAVAPRGARRRIGRSPRGLGTVWFHVGPCRSAAGRTTKKPLRPDGRGAAARARVPCAGSVHAPAKGARTGRFTAHIPRLWIWHCPT